MKVLGLYLYGEHVLDSVKDHPQLQQIKGDIRDRGTLQKVIQGCQAMIHLACISNDPSFELDPDLGKSINHDAFINLVDISRNSGVRRFIYASLSSVYGVKDEENVTEDLLFETLTDYSKYKAMCEEVLLKNRRVLEIAEMVRGVVGQDVRIETTPTNDNRSYHISSDKIKRELGFEARRTLEDAVRDLVSAFQAGKIQNSMTDDRYYNIKMMQKVKLH